ncbi:hypothetical protein C8Q73DRAFT_695021 [Cubamyces lactineus]|nr:hypothetical protein C8Q73DRAFT_695021 [Cubamyces lactineus]
MPPHSIVDAKSPSRLNSPNLRKLSSLSVSKHNRLRSFIRSQETYLASYAQEGRSAIASWNPSLSGPDTPKKSLQNVELESGFGTPLLKPRAVLKHAASTAEVPTTIDDGERTVVSSKNLGAQTKAKLPKTSKEAGSGSRSRPNREHIAGPGNKLFSSTRTKSNNRSTKSVSKRHHSSKLENGDTDEDHRARLAERRERRRAKKAIVDPEIKPVESDSGGDDDEDREQAKARRGSKKAAKGKGLKMPAGLALMHGFSATNIGKNRLTVGPNPAVGVFNKGKASAKTTVSKGKAAKLYPELFSEQRFLGKGKRENQSSGGLTDSSSGSRANDQGVLAEEDETHVRDNLPNHRKPTKEKRKRGRARAKSPSSGGDTEEDCSIDQAPRSPAKKRPRAESPTWDIELQDGMLPSDQESQTSDSSATGTRISGTVVLDTRAAQPKWSIATSTNQTPAVALLTTAQEPARSVISEASITPSHSASQAALHRSHSIDAPPVAVFSKYFAVPARPRSAVSYSAPASSPYRKSQVPPGLEEVDSESVSVYLEAVLQDPNSLSLSGTSPQQGLAARSLCAYPKTVSFPLGFSLGLRSPAVSMPASPVASEGLHRRPYLALDSDQLEPSSQRRGDWHGDSMRGAGVAEALAGTEDDAFICSEYVTMRSDYDKAAVLGYDVYASVFPAENSFAQVSTGEIGFYEGEDVVHRGHTTPSEGSCGPLAGAMSGQSGDAAQHLNRRLVFVEDYFEPGCPFHAEFANHGERRSDEQLYGNAYSSGDLLEADDDVRIWDQDNAEDGGDGEAEGFHYPRGTACDSAVVPLAATFGDVETATDLDDDFASESGSGHDQSVLGSLPRFSQGRALLMGVTEIEPGANVGRSGVSRAEEDVAKSLRGHWQPQRF